MVAGGGGAGGGLVVVMLVVDIKTPYKETLYRKPFLNHPLFKESQVLQTPFHPDFVQFQLAF